MATRILNYFKVVNSARQPGLRHGLTVAAPGIFDIVATHRLMNPPPFLTVIPDGLLLAVKLQPRASINEIIGPQGNELRVRVTAPPVDSAANTTLRRLLAETLGCPPGRVQLTRGHTSRHKVVRLHGISLATAILKLTGRRA